MILKQFHGNIAAGALCKTRFLLNVAGQLTLHCEVGAICLSGSLQARSYPKPEHSTKSIVVRAAREHELRLEVATASMSAHRRSDKKWRRTTEKVCAGER